MGAVIDAKTGKAHWFPFTISGWGADIPEGFNPISFRLNSKLVVFSGNRNERENDNGAHFYKIENGRFVHIRSVMRNE